MRFSTLLPTVVLTAGIALAGCSKKEDTAATPASTTDTAAAPADTAGEIDFKLSSPSGASNIPAPSAGSASTPPVPTAPRQNQSSAAPVAAGTQEELVPRYVVPPFYPLSKRMQGIEGRVNVAVVVDATGKVTEAQVVSSTAQQYNDYALAAARAWQFVPPGSNGESSVVIAQLPLQFRSEFASMEMPANSPLARLRYLDGSYYQLNDAGKHVLASREIEPIEQMEPPPVAASRAAQEAEIEFTVTEDGEAVNPQLVRASDPAFGKAVLDTIRFWRFVPRIRNGKPVAATAKKKFFVAPSPGATN